MKFVRHAWYVAGWSSEFSRNITRITIMNENIALYRTGTGKIVALHDRCPHKSLPLSMGRLIDDNIQCGYHGMTFNPEGHCVRIPGQESIPRSAAVRTFPAQEKNDIVWIWMGPPDEANEKEIFHLEEFDNTEWKTHQGDALYFQSNYLNVAENLVDPAHVSFVHPTTLGNPESEDVTVKTDVSGEVLVAWRWIRNAPPLAFLNHLEISRATLTGGITTIFICQALQ